MYRLEVFYRSHQPFTIVVATRAHVQVGGYFSSHFTRQLFVATRAHVQVGGRRVLLEQWGLFVATRAHVQVGGTRHVKSAQPRTLNPEKVEHQIR